MKDPIVFLEGPIGAGKTDAVLETASAALETGAKLGGVACRRTYSPRGAWTGYEALHLGTGTTRPLARIDSKRSWCDGLIVDADALEWTWKHLAQDARNPGVEALFMDEAGRLLLHRRLTGVPVRRIQPVLEDVVKRERPFTLVSLGEPVLWGVCMIRDMIEDDANLARRCSTLALDGGPSRAVAPLAAQWARQALHPGQEQACS